MTDNVALGYGILALVPLVLALGVAWAVHASQRPSHERVDPLTQYAPCMEAVRGQEWYCSNGRGYVLQAGRWIDVGPITGIGQVPQR